MVCNRKFLKLFLVILLGVFTMSTAHAVKTVVNDPNGRYTCTFEEADGERVVEVMSVKTTFSFLGFGKKCTENDILLSIGESLRPTCLIYKKIVYNYDRQGTVTITGLDGAKGKALNGALKAVIRFDQNADAKRVAVEPPPGYRSTVVEWVSTGIIKGDPCHTLIIQGDIVKLENHFFSNFSSTRISGENSGRFAPDPPCLLKYLDMGKSNIQTIGCGSFDDCPDLETVTFPCTLRKMPIHESGDPDSYYYSFKNSSKLDKQAVRLITALTYGAEAAALIK